MTSAEWRTSALYWAARGYRRMADVCMYMSLAVAKDEVRDTR